MSEGRSVLVTDAGRGSAIAIIRSLGRRGWRVVAGDSAPGSPGARSRYASDRLRYPDPALDPDGASDAILQAARERRLDLIVPVTDEVLLPLAARRVELPAGCILAAPSDDLLEVTIDKADTLDLARRVGVAVPDTRLVSTTAEALSAAPELGWPVVVKPRRSRARGPDGRMARFGVTYADDEPAVRRAVDPLEGRVDLLLQSYVPGVGVGVELLMDRGRALAAFAHRRLHEVPVTGGASSLRESIAPEPGLLEPAVQLLGALCWTGLAMVEWRIGPDGPVLMEINGRVWGSLPLALAAGMDFPRRLAEMLVGQAEGAPEGPADSGAEPATDYRIGVRSRNLDLEVVWIGSVLRGRRTAHGVPSPSRREALGAALRLIDPRERDDILTLDDPAPGVAELVRIARKLVGKLAGRAR